MSNLQKVTNSDIVKILNSDIDKLKPLSKPVALIEVVIAGTTY